MTLVLDSLLQRWSARYGDRVRRMASHACPTRPRDDAARRERQAGDGEDDSAGARHCGERLSRPSAQLTGVSKARPLAHLLTEAVTGVWLPTHDLAGHDIQRQLRSSKRIP